MAKNLVTKKTIKDMKKIKLKMDEEMYEAQLERYIKAIARYCFVEFSITGEGFEDLWKKEMFRTDEIIKKSGLSGRQKKKLDMETSIFSNNEKYVGEEHQYIKSQISFAKSKLDSLGWDKKLKVVEDCLSQKALWSKMMNINFKLREEIKELKKKQKKK